MCMRMCMCGSSRRLRVTEVGAWPSRATTACSNPNSSLNPGATSSAGAAPSEASGASESVVKSESSKPPSEAAKAALVGLATATGSCVHVCMHSRMHACLIEVAVGLATASGS